MNKKDLEYFKKKLLEEKAQLESELSDVAKSPKSGYKAGSSIHRFHTSMSLDSFW
jgi:RNA polymerase-binding transcription factor DksA